MSFPKRRIFNRYLPHEISENTLHGTSSLYYIMGIYWNKRSIGEQILIYIHNINDKIMGLL